MEIGDEVVYKSSWPIEIERIGVVLETYGDDDMEVIKVLIFGSPSRDAYIMYCSTGSYHKTGKRYSQADVLNFMLENREKEEKPMTNLEKYKKELDEVQKKLTDLKKKIAAESIEVGDEVEWHNSHEPGKGIVMEKVTWNNNPMFYIIQSTSRLRNISPEDCIKTGRHFDGIDDLLSFFKYNEKEVKQ